MDLFLGQCDKGIEFTANNRHCDLVILAIKGFQLVFQKFHCDTF